LPDPPKGPENRAILCIRTSVAGGPVLACTLHLVTKDPMKARQLAAAGRLLNEAARDGAVIVGGDFNTTPSGMGALLNPAKGGRYFDVDPQKADTHGRKIDYILFDRAHFDDPVGGPQYSPLSDHRLLLGHAERK
ncbi:MAG: endonuclease/exonuclease/phosphatase family protein, partial [Acidimicrobiia bacterium]